MDGLLPEPGPLLLPSVEPERREAGDRDDEDVDGDDDGADEVRRLDSIQDQSGRSVALVLAPTQPHPTDRHERSLGQRQQEYRQGQQADPGQNYAR